MSWLLVAFPACVPHGLHTLPYETCRAVLYLRLSNLTESSTSIDRQREECRRRAEQEGVERRRRTG